MAYFNEKWSINSLNLVQSFQNVSYGDLGGYWAQAINQQLFRRQLYHTIVPHSLSINHPLNQSKSGADNPSDEQQGEEKRVAEQREEGMIERVKEGGDGEWEPLITDIKSTLLK